MGQLDPTRSDGQPHQVVTDLEMRAPRLGQAGEPFIDPLSVGRRQLRIVAESLVEIGRRAQERCPTEDIILYRPSFLSLPDQRRSKRL